MDGFDDGARLDKNPMLLEMQYDTCHKHENQQQDKRSADSGLFICRIHRLNIKGNTCNGRPADVSNAANLAYNIETRSYAAIFNPLYGASEEYIPIRIPKIPDRTERPAEAKSVPAIKW